MEAEILFEIRGAIGLITLNRPKALNALNVPMVDAMREMLGEWAADDAVKAVVVQGAGEKSFCAGGDIRFLTESGKAGDGGAARFWGDEYRLNTEIKRYSKPYVALIDGITMGGGVGISVHAPYRVATERTLFAMPETGIGLFPDVGGGYFLPRLAGRMGYYLGLTGARLKAADTLHAGIATHYTASGNLPALVDRLAAGEAVEAVLADFHADPGPAPIDDHRADIDRLFTGETVEAVLAALDADGGDFAKSQAATIRTKSPTSLKLTLRQLQHGAGLEFEANMAMEFRLGQFVLKGSDFYEGVRAVIVDKDQSPKWNPPSLADVDDAEIEKAFAPLPQGDWTP
ncbi:enoyl-CoA hydratase/isomerase family protein [Zavarzinia compransoris]|uniref:enoyl-CoA hydratase/isomerase family protein n=1 Tax=Zavarzinia marina TaxID=2911065 RepID=UPI001F327B82|nr:enoyl-CoA hydratase/isomerase family protein [Zavarzinia marina]MCF4166270.1 enoyl-CoA hydratase/isomerase family protein [Zavarzinia marina]